MGHDRNTNRRLGRTATKAAGAAVLCVVLLLSLALCAWAAPQVPGDHWAAQALSWAVAEGLLTGSGDTLDPDSGMTGGQAVTLLVRVLDAQAVEEPYPGLDPSDWYYADAARAMAVGLLPTDGSLKLDRPLTRAEASELLCAAFGLTSAQEDPAAQSSYSDLAGLTFSQRQAMTALAALGVVQGTDGRLNPTGPVTRSQFVTMLYRLHTEAGFAVVAQTQADTQAQRLVFTCGVREVNLSQTTAQSAVVHASQLSSLTTQDAQLEELVLAQREGRPQLIGEGLTRVVFSGAGGQLNGGAPQSVEILSDGGTVDLTAVKAAQVVISGSGNVVSIDYDSQLDTLIFTADSRNNQVRLSGWAKSVTLAGSGNRVDGSGIADQVLDQGGDNRANVSFGAWVDQTPKDTGLSGISLTITAPTVAPGEALTATARFSGVTDARTVGLYWYLDGVLVREYPEFALYDGAYSSMWEALQFGRSMALQHTLAVYAVYDNPVTGQRETASQTAVVAVQNYTRETYQAYDYQLAVQVSGTYAGDYSESYNPDYSTAVKEAFVNYYGYTSRTQYMVWVSRATQKVNIFQLDAVGEWALLYTFRCGTGAYGTPEGETYIFGKESGWTTSTYSVYNVVNFYPGTGYAFHSRLYAPNTLELTEAGIGYPISHGCVRMYLEDVQWMWENLPLYTTVVVY